MNKHILEEMISRNLSTRLIAKEIGCSQCKVKYWLKKHNLKTQLLRYNKGKRGGFWGDNKYICKTCEETREDKFMLMANGEKSYTRCKKCHNLITIKRGRENKQKYIEYKGGSCEKCGYKECVSALEFHHKTAGQKDPSFSSMRYWGLEKAKKELNKCLLLCSNCHREKHENLW